MRTSFIAAMRPSFKAYMRPTTRPLMRPSFVRLNKAAPKSEAAPQRALELYPLFAACFVVVCSATYFTWKHLTHDSLKLGRKVPQHNEKLIEVISQPSPAPAEEEAQPEAATESA